MTTSDPAADPTDAADDSINLPDLSDPDLRVVMPPLGADAADDPINLPDTIDPDLRVAIPPEATEEILAVLRRHGVEGYLSSIVISTVPNPVQFALQRITYYYKVGNICKPFSKPRRLPHCKL